MRLLIYILVFLIGGMCMPMVIKTLLPGLPISLNGQPEPFYWAVESPRNPGGVLLQYYGPLLNHQVISGDTAFLYPHDVELKAFQGDSDGLEKDALKKGGIVALELEHLGNHRHRLHVRFDDIGPSGASFLYREVEEGIEPIWASYDGVSGLVPILGGKAWALMTAIWLGLCGIGFGLMERRSRKRRLQA